MHRVSAEERRARLVRRHLLVPSDRVESVAEVARALVAVHSTDPATVFLSVRARSVAPLGPASIEDELYEQRTVVRMLGMRRTLFVVPRETRPVVQAACTNDVAARERAKLAGWLAKARVADERALLRAAEQAALAAV
ncbi:MAG TPA: crosslink repair DNA glycosylase YcaQ family protein, partial [Gaiellaceae bacterium]|nr:crosslink repair DNA glycosylase YcaQ family protein [Gaiellaceae bacterium]